MADPTVHDLEEEVVLRLHEEAVREGVSQEEAHRRLLRRALLDNADQHDMSFHEFLLTMPDLGEDIWLQLERERRCDQARPPVDL